MYRQALARLPGRKALPLKGYIKPDHFDQVKSGKARGRDVTVKDGHVYIDIKWYRMLAQGDKEQLCGLLETNTVMQQLGNLGLLSIMVKKPKQPLTVKNTRGITVASHLSKV